MMKPGIGAERVYTEAGCVYVIRDVWAAADNALGVKLERCEYKTKGPGGDEQWTPCREDVSFSEIEPYEYSMPARNWAV